MHIKTIGIDLGKTACDVVAMDGRGKVVLRRRLSRAKLVAWLANLAPARLGMEASCGAHHLARRLRELGHDVRLMPAQYVRPFVKTNKHDQADAEAIAEAVQRPQMRFVPIKSAAQLDLQALHRARDRLIAQRTGLINQIRAFLLERGVVVRQGRLALAKALPELLEAQSELSPMIRALLGQLRAQWQALDGEIAALDQQILSLARAHPLARQDGTGGKVRLLGISKRGNGYLRRLLVHAARAVKRSAKHRDDRLGAWLRGLEARAHPNVATVALAAKLARWSWAVLAHNQVFRPTGA
jgi:transposase